MVQIPRGTTGQADLDYIGIGGVVYLLGEWGIYHDGDGYETATNAANGGGGGSGGTYGWNVTESGQITVPLTARLGYYWAIYSFEEIPDSEPSERYWQYKYDFEVVESSSSSSGESSSGSGESSDSGTSSSGSGESSDSGTSSSGSGESSNSGTSSSGSGESSDSGESSSSQSGTSSGESSSSSISGSSESSLGSESSSSSQSGTSSDSSESSTSQSSSSRSSESESSESSDGSGDSSDTSGESSSGSGESSSSGGDDCPCKGPDPDVIDTTSTGVTVEHPKSSRMPKATDALLELFWEATNQWVRVTPNTTPPGDRHPGGPTGMMWWISGLEPDTQYRIRFMYLCKEGGECPGGETRFTTDEPSSSSSSSGGACPCGGPAPQPGKPGPCELGVPIPTSGLVNVTGDPTLQILWDGTWVTVSDTSTPRGEILPDKGGRYWSVSGLQPLTTYFFLFTYFCDDGVSSCQSEIGQGTTTKPCNCGDPALCGEGCC